jgi:cobyrinic acid a,c-diamide synthase
MENIKQFMAKEDGCFYFYDEKIRMFRKICVVETVEELPDSVKEQIRAAKAAAAEIVRIPEV